MIGRVIWRCGKGGATRTGGINHRIMGEASHIVRGNGIGRGVEVTDQVWSGRWWNREGGGDHGPRKDMEVRG